MRTGTIAAATTLLLAGCTASGANSYTDRGVMLPTLRARSAVSEEVGIGLDAELANGSGHLATDTDRPSWEFTLGHLGISAGIAPGPFELSLQLGLGLADMSLRRAGGDLDTNGFGWYVGNEVAWRLTHWLLPYGHLSWQETTRRLDRGGDADWYQVRGELGFELRAQSAVGLQVGYVRTANHFVDAAAPSGSGDLGRIDVEGVQLGLIVHF